jgi:hypothetical protein
MTMTTTRFGRVFGVLLLAVGCDPKVDDTDDIPDDTRTGEIRVNLGSTADGELPSQLEEVWVRFEDVQVEHDARGWLSIADARQDVNLMALRDGSTTNIGRGDVYQGAYGALRLLVADAWVVADGEEVPLTLTEDIPGLLEPGIQLEKGFFVDAGITTTLTTHWNLASQLVDEGDAWTLGTSASVDVRLEE